MLLALDGYRSRLLEGSKAIAPFAVLAAAGMLVFTWMCDAVGDRDGITSVDGPVSLWFATHRSLWEGQVGLVVARATSPAVLVLLVVAASVLLWLRRRRFEAAALATAVVAAYGVGGLAKLAEHRARPAAPVNLAPETEGSFPSGHVLVIATIAVVAVTLAWRHLSAVGRLLAVLAATIATVGIAADRLLVGAHWVTDVIGSLALATVIGAAVMALTELRSRQVG